MKVLDLKKNINIIISYTNYFLFTLLTLLIFLFDRDLTHLNLSFHGFPFYVVELVLLIISLLFLINILLQKDKTAFINYKLKFEHILLMAVMLTALIIGLIKYGNIFVFRHSAIFYYSVFTFLISIIFINFKQFEIFIIVSVIVIFFTSILRLFIGAIELGDFLYYYQALFIIISVNSLIFLKNKFLIAIIIIISSVFLYGIFTSVVRAAWVGLVVATIFNILILIIYRKKLCVRKAFYLIIFLIAVLSLVIFILLNFLNLDFSGFQNIQEQTTESNNKIQEQTIESSNEAVGNLGQSIKKEAKNYIEEFSSIYNFNKIDTSSGNNAKWRLIVWKDIIQKSLKKPILGYGFGMLYNNETLKNMDWASGSDVGFLDPHNSYLSILYRTGFVGLFVFLFFIGSFFYKSLRFLAKCKDVKICIYMISTLSVVVFILSISFFMVVLEGPYLGIFLWVFIGLTLALMNVANIKQPAG